MALSQRPECNVVLKSGCARCAQSNRQMAWDPGEGGLLLALQQTWLGFTLIQTLAVAAAVYSTTTSRSIAQGPTVKE